MKIRNILYGYQYQNGVIVRHPQESVTVKRIFESYLAGQSLLKIAEQFNREQIEYMPDVIGWNKARLMRLIDEERYLGTDSYPPIVDAHTHEAVRRLKAEKNTQKQVDRGADIFHLGVPVRCPQCGAEMHRRHDSSRRCKQWWTCQNSACKERIVIADEDLLTGITDTLNAVIANPNQIRLPAKAEKAPDTTVMKMENEIARVLETTGFDKETLRQKLLRCLSLKYQNIDHDAYAAKKMKTAFERACPLNVFSADLMEKTVKSITLNTDGTVCLTLMNDQIIQKELTDCACNSHPNDAA